MSVLSTICTPEESDFGVAKIIALPTARFCVPWDSLAQEILSRVYYTASEDIAAVCSAPGTEVPQLTLSSSVTSAVAAAGVCPWASTPILTAHLQIMHG